MTHTVKVLDFTKYPGPRNKKFGKYSGEEFRDTVLIPAIKQFNNIIVDLDGVMGYGSSFLDESFGGLLRSGIENDTVDFIIEHIKSDTNPDLIDEIIEYVEEEKVRQRNG